MAVPLAVVLNRTAGGGRAAREWPRLRGELHAWGVSYRLIDSASPAQALAAVSALPPGWAVATVGGDGTVASVLPAVIEQQRPLLVLPFGTGNDFASTLGLRAGQFREALAGLDAPARPVDALRVSYGGGPQPGGQAYSLNGVGMGFDAQLTANLPLAPAWTQGPARYLWAALATLRAMQPQPCRVLLDGAELYGGPAMLCSVLNARSLGGGFQFNPDAKLTDGRLNVVVAGDVSRRQVPPLIAQVRIGKHVGHPAVRYAAGQVAELHWEQPVQLHVDGDLKGEQVWLRVEVLPGAVALLGFPEE
ncbi:diacylglycerol kinase [Deinococcus piscis]|uniref:Diacylglycerol kinase n=1 Tax=Deinococcus piscis TaxID=394230 RepID=A0ABQ3K3F6_9DEIO|nr:diacylglycerol kinase family protein [Deinococcus piscis]GHF98224.1 diacylglycerol kinase [Deinococcus piscis]